MYRVHGSLMAMQRQCWFSIPCLLQGEIRCESILGPVVRGHQVTEVGKTVKKKSDTTLTPWLCNAGWPFFQQTAFSDSEQQGYLMIHTGLLHF